MLVEPTLPEVRQMEAVLGEFPFSKIKSRFEDAAIKIDLDKVPRRFEKYLSVMKAVAGGTLAGKSLVDFGCGLGIFVAQAARLGMNAEGIDIFSEYGGHCREAMSHIACCIAADCQPRSTLLDFMNNEVCRQVDFVTSFGMLEHIHGAANRDLIIRRMMQALKPGGYFILTCGPNKRFPIDLHHYGPKFVFYHCLPVRIRRLYVQLFARRGQNLDPSWLNGMSVNEIRAAIIENGGSNIEALFPLWIRLGRHRLLNWPLVRQAAVAAAKLLCSLGAEPVIILIAQKQCAIEVNYENTHLKCSV